MDLGSRSPRPNSAGELSLRLGGGYFVHRPNQNLRTNPQSYLPGLCGKMGRALHARESGGNSRIERRTPTWRLQPLDCGRIDALSLPRAKQAGVPPHGPEGGIDHWTGSHQYWVDTLYMACPVLARSGRLENKPAYV